MIRGPVGQILSVSKRFINMSILNVFVVAILLGLSIILLYVTSPMSETIFASWGAVSASNWLRFGAATLLSAFLPGFFLFDVLNKKGFESPVRYFLFSYLLSVLIISVANLFAFLVFGSWNPLNVLVLANCVLFGIWVFAKRGKVGCSRVSSMLIFAFIVLLLFFLFVSSVHNFFIYGDQFDYNGWAISWAEAPFYSLNGVIQPSYPWLAFAYLSTLFKTTGLPSVNTYVPLIVLNMMPIVAFFCLVRTKANAHVSAIASFLAFFTSGFGWVYLPLINAENQVNALQQLGWKTYDITVPNSFLSVTPDLSTSLLLIGLPSLLAVLAVMFDDNQISSQKRYYFLTAVLTALAFLSHIEAGAILTGIFVLLVLANYVKNTRLQLSFLCGLLLVLVIDLVAPVQYYITVTVDLASSHTPLLLLCIVAVSVSILLAKTYRANLLDSLTTVSVKKTKNLLSKLRSVDYIVLFSFSIVQGALNNDNPPNKRFKCSLRALVFALLIILSYSVTLVIYSIYFFPIFHFNVSLFPWFIYPVRFGMVGALSLGFLLGCILFQWNKKEKLPYALILGIPLLLFLGYCGLYQQQRVMKYIPLLIAPFAAEFAIKSANYFSKKVYSKIRGRVIQVTTLLLILSLCSSSMALYLQYESLCQDPTHYSTLAMRIPISDSVASAAEFIAGNSNFGDMIAAFPIGYGGAYAYMSGLTGRDTMDFLPIFAMKEPINFFQVASDIQLKYVYISTSEKGLINKYYKDGFLNFYTSIASIAHETSETKIYSVPTLFPPSEDPECLVIDMSAFIRSSYSQNSSFLSYLTLALSGVQYAPCSYSSVGLSQNIETIIVPLDPNSASIDGYLEWVNNGGNLIVIGSDQLGSFSTFLNFQITGIGEINSIRSVNTSISTPNIQLPLVSSDDPNVTIQAYYSQDKQLKSSFLAESHIGNGTIKYLFLAPLFSYLLSNGNGSVHILSQIAPSIINMLGFKVDISRTNPNRNTPNYVLERPTYSGNITCITNHLTFNAPTVTLKQSNSIEQSFKDASVDITGSITIAIGDSSGSISAGIPQSQEINPTRIYDDEEDFWKTYLGHGTGTVGNVSIVHDVNTFRSGNSSTKIIIESGSQKNSGIYHNFATTNWSSAKKISLYIYGSGTNVKISLSLFSGAETAADVLLWEIIDNFTGWKKLAFDFSNPTRIGSNFNISDIKKMYLWSDSPGAWNVDRFTLDVSGPTQFAPSLTFQNSGLKDMTLVLSKGTQLVITSESQDTIIITSEEQKISIKADPNDIYLEAFSTTIAIDGLVTFKGSYGYWLEQIPTVHDTISISGLTSFKPVFAELISYVYAEDIFRDYVVEYPTNPIIYISDLQLTGKYSHIDEK